MGVSLVMHPRNPHCPTVHMNVRLLDRDEGRRSAALLVRRRHGSDALLRLRRRRAAFSPRLPRRAGAVRRGSVPALQAWCDEYFYLKHRNEPRGIGGIFFDDFAERGFERSFAMMQSVGDCVPGRVSADHRAPARHAVQRGEREFQAYRRGRYVEFNLVFDRGTLFGLQSGGRTESILMSMPPVANWRYNWQPEPGTPEARLYADFLVPNGEWI